MSRHGLTLVETLLALALVSALMVACVSWATTLARAQSAEGGPISWRAAAERTLDVVDRAITVDDAAPPGGSGHWRVACEPGVLTLRTRAVLDGDDGRPLVCDTARVTCTDDTLRIAYAGGDGPGIAPRPMLGEVSVFDVSAVEIDERTIGLRVRLAHSSGETVERSWRFRKGDVR